MGLAELKNNIDGTNLSFSNIKTIFKDHIADYWINSPDKDGVDLKLDIVGDETLTADCDVTDHYVESNVAYQDQITLKPQIYTISGEVGELVWYQKNPVSQTIGQVAQKLEGVISFLPIRSKGFSQMKKTVMKASQWVDTASNALTKLSSLVGGSGFVPEAMSRQQQAYQLLVLYRNMRKPLTVKTPWGVLKDYVITNLEFKQPKETKDKSYISITFKEFRLTQINTVPFDMSKYQGNAAFENQPIAEQGKTAGEDASLTKETITTSTGKEEVCRVPVENGFVNFTEKDGLLAALDDQGKPILDDATYLEGIASAVDRCSGKIREVALQEALESGMK